ncbi:MAG: GtrA family protein, partial [Candidatus Saccharimonadales bacterium]
MSLPAKAHAAFYRLPRMLQFMAIGGSVFGVGFGMLAVLVGGLGWTETSANALQLTVTFVLNLILNRKLTWYDRDVSRLVAFKFLASRAITSVIIGYWMFNELVNLGVHYLLTNILCVGTMTIANFITSDRWVFADRTPQLRLVRSLWFYRGRNLIGALLVLSAALMLWPDSKLASVLAIIATVTFCLATFEVVRVVYAYRSPDVVDQIRFPEPVESEERIAIIVPARHEQGVLKQTLTQLAQQTHPNFWILPTVCSDDPETLAEAHAAATQYPGRITVLEYERPEGITPSKSL